VPRGSHHHPDDQHLSKYSGKPVAAFLFVTFYVAMTLAALAIEMLFQALSLAPRQRNAEVVPVIFRPTTQRS